MQPLPYERIQTPTHWDAASPRIFLIGFMATGKSSVGRALAASYGIPFIDLDRRIVTAAGMEIPQIFAEQGERAFRDLETGQLAALAQDDASMVVACGGGVPLRAENRALLARAGCVIELHASPETIQRRVGRAADRPVLSGRTSTDAIRRLMEERRPAYAAAAHIRVAVDGRRIDGLCITLRGILAALAAPDLLEKPATAD